MSGFAGPLAQSQRLVGRPDQAAITLRHALLVRPDDEVPWPVACQLNLERESPPTPDATLAILDNPAPASGRDVRSSNRRRLSATCRDLKKIAPRPTDATARKGLAIRHCGAEGGSCRDIQAVHCCWSTWAMTSDGAFDIAERLRDRPTRFAVSRRCICRSQLPVPRPRPHRCGVTGRFIGVARTLGLVDCSGGRQACGL